MNRLELYFDYGFWLVVIERRKVPYHACHAWLIVALVKALWRYFAASNAQEGK